jgi:hypothetical protein
MEPQKIKIELEATPEIAMFLSLYLATTLRDDFTFQKALTDTGAKYLHDIAQSIIDQIAVKTDFDNLRIRNVMSYLKDPEGLNYPPNGLTDLLN